MLRRTLLTCSVLLLASMAMPAHAGSGSVEFKPGVIKSALAEGKTVFVDYAADWCTTCKRQERVVEKLRSENPAYDNAMTFVRVDWDTYQRDEVRTSRKIPRRSTLILLKGDKELGRIIAGTSESQIKGLMDKAL